MKRPEITPWNLGGTLFVPATHKHLGSIAKGDKFPSLRSMVIDTEDGIDDTDLPKALQSIDMLLSDLTDTPLYRFIRPKDPETLQKLLHMKGIEKIDGFVLPKFGIANMPTYLSMLETTPFVFMPSIEGSELFDADLLKTIRNFLLPYRSRIPLIRFGAEDMLRQLGLRRECSVSLFDMCAPSQIIGNLIGIFKPHGFELSGGVYRCYKDQEGFMADVMRDVQEGLMNKTIIHPNQILLVDRCYQVSLNEYAEAKKIAVSEKGVFALNGTMAETKTQQKWAFHILERAQIYGLKP